MMTVYRYVYYHSTYLFLIYSVTISTFLPPMISVFLHLIHLFYDSPTVVPYSVAWWKCSFVDVDHCLHSLFCSILFVILIPLFVLIQITGDDTIHSVWYVWYHIYSIHSMSPHSVVCIPTDTMHSRYHWLTIHILFYYSDRVIQPDRWHLFDSFYIYSMMPFTIRCWWCCWYDDGRIPVLHSQFYYVYIPFPFYYDSYDARWCDDTFDTFCSSTIWHLEPPLMQFLILIHSTILFCSMHSHSFYSTFDAFLSHSCWYHSVHSMIYYIHYRSFTCSISDLFYTPSFYHSTDTMSTILRYTYHFDVPIPPFPFLISFSFIIHSFVLYLFIYSTSDIRYSWYIHWLFSHRYSIPLLMIRHILPFFVTLLFLGSQFIVPADTIRYILVFRYSIWYFWWPLFCSITISTFHSFHSDYIRLFIQYSIRSFILIRWFDWHLISSLWFIPFDLFFHSFVLFIRCWPVSIPFHSFPFIHSFISFCYHYLVIW